MSGYSKSVLRGIFRRKGKGTERTNFPEELRADLQQRLETAVVLDSGEEPVVASFPDEDGWVLITTSRLISYREGGRFELASEMIAGAKTDRVAENRRGVSRKSDFQYLRVLTLDGNEIELTVESGAPFSGLWNLLEMIGGRNRRMVRERSPRRSEN